LISVLGKRRGDKKEYAILDTIPSKFLINSLGFHKKKKGGGGGKEKHFEDSFPQLKDSLFFAFFFLYLYKRPDTQKV
jgi:hypothetical protein